MKSEKQFVEKFVRIRPVLKYFLEIIDYPVRTCWIGININTKLLFPECDRKPGDIDMLIGNIVNGVPTVDNLAAIEIKYFNFKKQPANSKNLPSKSSGIDQTEGLVNLGFDAVHLAYFLSKPPGTGNNIWAWFNGTDFQNADSRILNRPNRNQLGFQEIIHNKPFGFVIFGLGQVGERDPERSGGSGILHPIKKCELQTANRMSEKTRKKIETVIIDAFNNFIGCSSNQTVLPNIGPLLLKHCGNKQCKALFFTNSLLTLELTPTYCSKCEYN